MNTTDKVDAWLASRAGPRTQAHVYRFPAGTDQEQISKRETAEAIEDFCSTLQPEVAEAASEFQGDDYRPIQSGAFVWPLVMLAVLAAVAVGVFA